MALTSSLDALTRLPYVVTKARVCMSVNASSGKHLSGEESNCPASNPSSVPQLWSVGEKQTLSFLDRSLGPNVQQTENSLKLHSFLFFLEP